MWGTCASSQLKGVLRPGIIVGDIHDSQDTYCGRDTHLLPTLKFQIGCVSQNKLNSASPEQARMKIEAQLEPIMFESAKA